MRSSAYLLSLFTSVLLILLFAACNLAQTPLALLDTGIAGTSTGDGALLEDSYSAPGAYPKGTLITVKASPEPGSSGSPGSVFTGCYSAPQGGVLISTENPYSQTMQDVLSLFARFDMDIARHDLTTWESIGTAGWGVKVPVIALPEHFQIWNAEEGSVELDLLSLVYMPALRRNPETLEWEASLAESFEVAGDATSVTITLREGLYWSDGEELTAEDFVFAASVYQSGEVVVARDLSVNGNPTSWSAFGTREYTVSTDGTSYGSLLEIAAIPPLPEHMLGPVVTTHGMDALNGKYSVDSDPETIVGNGPFRIVDISFGGSLLPESVMLWKNPYYFEKDAAGIPLPYLPAMMFVPGNPIDLFNADDADLCVVQGDNYEQIDRSDATVYNAGPGEMQILFMNQNPDEGDGGVAEPALTWLTEPDFRTALAHLVNRARIVNEVYSGYATPVYSPIHPQSPYWADPVTPVPQYSVAEANRLLNDLGWIDSGDDDNFREKPTGTNIQLTLIVDSANAKAVALCNIIVEEADDAGISITVDPLTSLELSDRLYITYDWELACVGMQTVLGDVAVPVLDPALLDSVIPSDGANHLSEPGQTSPRYTWEQTADDQWAIVMETPDDFTAARSSVRYTALQTIQEIWATNVPWIYIVAPNTYEVYQNNLSNVSADILHPFEGYGREAIISRLFYE